MTKCRIKGCKRDSELTYYKKPLCLKCFEKYETEQLKEKLGIKEEKLEEINIEEDIFTHLKQKSILEYQRGI